MMTRKAFPAFVSVSATLLLFAPSFAFAQVIVSEIAWMGTAVSANDEWIELENQGSEVADINGWTLSTQDGGIEAALSGAIPAGGYFLLERTDDDTVPGVLADALYTGSLSNAGEVLVLKNASGNIVDSVNMSGGWNAGDNATKDTMQKVAGVWATGIPTPKAKNSTVATPVTEGSTAGGSGSPSSATPASYSAHSSSASLVKPKAKGEMEISMSRDRIIPAGSEVRFSASAKDGGGIIKDVAFSWAWGDGTKSQGMEASHIYKYPGEYVVALNAISDGRTATARASVKVFSPEIALTLERENGVRILSLANSSPYEINIGRFALRAGDEKFYFPDDTIVPAGGKLMLDEETTGLSFSAVPIALIFHSGKSITLAPALPFAEMESTLIRVMGEARTIESKLQANALLAAPARTALRVEQSGEWGEEDRAGVGEKGEREKEEPKREEQVVIVKKPENIFMRIFHFFFR